MNSNGSEHMEETLKDVSVVGQHAVRSVLEPLRAQQSITETKAPYQYYEPAEGTGGLPAVICTCGASKHHLRMKVLQIWSLKHFQKTGHNTREKA